jgi:hypothetical protein
MLKRLVLSALVIGVFGVGCSSEGPLSPNPAQVDDSALLDSDPLSDATDGDNSLTRWGHDSWPVKFKVTLKNVSTTSTLQLSNGDTAPAPHSPGVWTITRLNNPLFRIGQFDQGLGLEQQAEDGDPTMLAQSMLNNPWVKSSGVFNTPVGDAGPGPATPGKAFEFEVTAYPGDHLSFTTMFGQSNDLFYAPGATGIPLFRGQIPVHGDFTRAVFLWDAGTEVNEEPGLGPNQAPRQSGPNTGPSEHLRVLKVNDEYTYPRTNEVIELTIVPVEEPEQTMFTVRIENVSTAMTLHLSNGDTAPAPHSPGVWTITRLKNPLFNVGQFDQGLGLEQQAEDGDPTMLAANMMSNPWVKSTGVFNTPVGDASPGPATPGKAFEFTVMASPGDHLSFTSMFGQSNDLFYAPGAIGIPLFNGYQPRHGDVTGLVSLWDAGTEVNEEPGLGPNQAPRQSGPNTGPSEHERVLRVHDEYTYPRTDEVIKVTVMPVSNPA